MRQAPRNERVELSICWVTWPATGAAAHATHLTFAAGAIALVVVIIGSAANIQKS